MRILVCIKQVADPESKPVLSADGKWASYGENTSYRINRFDEHAIECALQIREASPGTLIDVISIGPQRVRNAIRRAIEMGADSGFHIEHDKDGFTSPLQRAHMIAGFYRKKKYDLIITGAMSQDMMSGQTGPMTAALLGIPSATTVIAFRINALLKNVRVERELESGLRTSMDLALPALLAVQSGINRPRYPSLSNVMRAKTADIETVTPAAEDLIRPRENVRQVMQVTSGRGGVVLQGSSEEKAEALWQMLHEKSLI